MSVVEICTSFDHDPTCLIEILHEVQREEKFISDDAIAAIAEALNRTQAEILGVVSFYHDFRRTPPNATNIQICRAESCQAVGCADIVSYAEKTLNVTCDDARAEDAFSLTTVFCLGNCALGPACMVNGRLIGRVSNDTIDALAKGGNP